MPTQRGYPQRRRNLLRDTLDGLPGSVTSGEIRCPYLTAETPSCGLYVDGPSNKKFGAVPLQVLLDFASVNRPQLMTAQRKSLNDEIKRLRTQQILRFLRQCRLRDHQKEKAAPGRASQVAALGN